MPIARIVVVIPGPRIATTASASSSTGNANMTSTTRMNTVSTQPPRYPATTPTVTPTTTANATLTTATRIDACVATRTRDNTSRPSSSVPNQWSPPGGCNALGTSTSLTPNGVIQLAVTATNTMTPNTIALTTVTGLRSSSRHEA